MDGEHGNSKTSIQAQSGSSQEFSLFTSSQQKSSQDTIQKPNKPNAIKFLYIKFNSIQNRWRLNMIVNSI